MARERVLSFRLTDAERDALDALAVERGTDRTGIVRAAIRRLLAPPLSAYAQTETSAAHACII